MKIISGTHEGYVAAVTKAAARAAAVKSFKAPCAEAHAPTILADIRCISASTNGFQVPLVFN